MIFLVGAGFFLAGRLVAREGDRIYSDATQLPAWILKGIGIVLILAWLYEQLKITP